MLKEFQPTLLFLGKFLGVFIGLSALYGWMLTQYDNQDPPVPDPFSVVVTQHTVDVLNIVGSNWSHQIQTGAPFIDILKNGQAKVSVFEGCNGVNIAILFLSFIVAFGGPAKKMAWFIPAGLVFIHLANIFRIAVLAVIAGTHERAFYFFHKFGFTGVIYGAIFLLWVIWVAGVNRKVAKNPETHAE
jgi:exosortase family protein XrtF